MKPRIPVVLVSIMIVALAGCQSTRLVPTEDHGGTTRWLEIGHGSFRSTSRIVVTDQTFVSEYYERVDKGRDRGRHVLKEQSKVHLSPEKAREFWLYVDSVDVFDWSDADLPDLSVQTSLVYRRGANKIELPSSEGGNGNGTKLVTLERKIYTIR